MSTSFALRQERLEAAARNSTETLHVSVRYSPRPAETSRMSSAELREAFLIQDLFAPGEFRTVLTDADRLAVAGVLAVEPVVLPPVGAFGTAHFSARRETGVFNIGGPGVVRVDGEPFHLDRFDCLYLGAGNEDVVFEPAGAEQPVFYLASCPAHRALPAQVIRAADAGSEMLGESALANRRRLNRYIHPDGAESCQLVMGMTELHPGGVWNTMPPHTHSRRSEIYLYFDVPADGAVFHIMGEPSETRHIVVHNREAVISPPWSLHSGVGTSAYRFIWAMAGENQDFGDMDPAPLQDLR